MHDQHDLDLIAGYADGSKDPAAARLLESCTDCRAEFELHSGIRAMLAGTPAVAMTDAERVAMRDGVRAGLERPPAPVVSLAERRQRRWLAIGSVAAAMFVTVGVAGVMTQGGDTSDTFADIAAGVDDGGTGAPEAADSDEALQSAEALTATTAAGAADETVAAADTTAAVDDARAGDGAAGRLVDAGQITRTELDEQLEATIAQLIAGTAPEELDVAFFNDLELPAPSCLTSGTGPVYGVVNATVDGRDVQAFVVLDPETGEYHAEILAVDGCTLVP